MVLLILWAAGVIEILALEHHAATGLGAKSGRLGQRRGPAHVLLQQPVEFGPEAGVVTGSIIKERQARPGPQPASRARSDRRRGQTGRLLRVPWEGLRPRDCLHEAGHAWGIRDPRNLIDPGRYVYGRSMGHLVGGQVHPTVISREGAAIQRPRVK